MNKLFNLNIQEADYYRKCVVTVLGIPFKVVIPKLSKNEIKKFNAKYELKSEVLLVPKVKDNFDTLDELVNTNKSICRYGDGEFAIIFKNGLNFQDYQEDLGQRLAEILLSDVENVMVAIPDRFSALDNFGEAEKYFWRKYMVYNRDKINKILRFDKQYYDACVSRPYIALKDKFPCKDYFEKIKMIYAGKDIIFVEGEASRLGYKNDLFSSAKSIRRIICPAQNAFDKYDEILETCKKYASQNTIFIIALGPTATILAYDLANAGYRALDLGHIDIEYEWFLMGAKKKVPIKNKYVNEVKSGRKVSVVEDENYLNEIIANLS